MIPRIYSAGTDDFESNGEGLLVDSYDWHVVEESNEDFTAEFKYPVDGPLMNFIKIGNIIKTDASKRLKNQKFRIYKIQPQLEQGYTTVYARHTSFSTLYDFIPTEINLNTSQSCEYALNQIFQNSIESKHIKGKSDIVNGQTFKIGYVTPAEAIKGVRGSIIDTYGNGAHIVRDNSVEETISVVKDRGKSNNMLIAYGKNLSGFNGDEDDSDVITRMIPFANTQDSEGNQMTYRPKTFSYVDADNINDYDMIYTRAVDMTDKFEQDEVVTDSKLKTLCEQYYAENKCNYPKMTYEITFEELDLTELDGSNLDEIYELGMQDVVLIWNTKFNIRTETRIIETDYNPLIDGYNSLVLGDPRSNMVSIIGSDAINETVRNENSEDNVFDLGDYPDTLPETPELTANPLVASIELNWTYISKPYYEYELYGSQVEDFVPSTFNLLYSGLASTFLHQAQPNQTWFYRVRAVNTHKRATPFSTQISASTIKIDDASNWIENAAIGDALIGTLKLDRGWVGQLTGNWIDARQLSVTDSNGKRTLDIDSGGNVSIDAASVKIASKSVDSIAQQKIDDLKLGGVNILRNTQWDDAIPGEGTCPKWTFNNLQIYEHQGELTYNKPNTIYLVNSSDTERGAMSQVINAEYLPRNTEFTISCNITSEANVKDWYMNLDYYSADDTCLNTQVLLTKDEGEGYREKTLTTLDIDYSYVAFHVTHGGSSNGATLHILMINKLMFEIGNKASEWKKSTFDMVTQANLDIASDRIMSTVETNYATKSEVTQTAEDITFKFANVSYSNYIYNGDFSNDFNSWSQYNSSSSGISIESNDYGHCCKIVGEIGQTKYISQTIPLYGARVSDFTASAIMKVTNGTNGSTNPFYHLYAEVNYTDSTTSYHDVTVYEENTWLSIDLRLHELDKYNKCVDTIKLFFFVRDTTRTGYITQIMMNKGKSSVPYTPAVGEVNTDTTKIDGTGVNVIHNDGSKTNLNSQALNFYNNEGVLYSQVQGGNHKFWYGSHYVGSLEHSRWTYGDADQRLLVLGSQYSDATVIGSKIYEGESGYMAYLTVCGKEQYVGLYLKPGVYMASPYTDYVFSMYDSLSNSNEQNPGKLYVKDDHIRLNGYQGIQLGIYDLSNVNGFLPAIKIERTSSSPYTQCHIHTNLDMHNYSISNAKIANTVSATSAQTYALRTKALNGEDTYSDSTSKTITDIYPVQSLTNGDIRWSDKQTYFTSEVEEGIYEAYVEIPWWLAQNIELDYHVNITPVNGFYQYYVSERDSYYFIVRSDKDSMGFTFELVATLLEQNTLNNNASIASEQYSTAEDKEDKDGIDLSKLTDCGNVES